MSDKLETFDLDINSLDEPISFNYDNGSKSFGGGIELLMNTSKKSAPQSSNISLGDLDTLESELNAYSSPASSSSSSASASSASAPAGETKMLSGLTSFFGFGGNGSSSDDSKIGQATKETNAGITKSSDGFMKFNDLPDTREPIKNNMSDRDKLRKKKLMIKRLEEWRTKGLVSNNTMFNNDTPYEEIEDEYETALEDKKKGESKKLYGWWFMTFVNTVEYANAAFNPFDINLDGWGEQVNDDIDSYDEIFGELYDKYKGGKLSPEIALLMRLGFSAAVVNLRIKPCRPPHPVSTM